jgi:hypothetical protein
MCSSLACVELISRDRAQRDIDLDALLGVWKLNKQFIGVVVAVGNPVNAAAADFDAAGWKHVWRNVKNSVLETVGQWFEVEFKRALFNQ